MEPRLAWNDLPEPLKQAIQARTGPITSVRIATAGQNSPLAATVDTSSGKVFVKGIPSAHRQVITQAREAAAAPLVKDISPALLWHFDEAGWNVLGYEHAPGRHADYTPGSPDLDQLVHLMDTLSTIKTPANPGPLKRAEDRWKPYLDNPESASAFAGPVLTHSDWTPDNVLISPDRAWLIDWAWPTLAAAWTDPACWILRLMASGGHTAPQAEQQANRLPAFQTANPAHIDLFAAANARLWDEITQSSTSTSTWTKDMAQAALTWHAYRQARLPAAQHARMQPETLPAGTAARAVAADALLPARAAVLTESAGTESLGAETSSNNARASARQRRGAAVRVVRAPGGSRRWGKPWTTCPWRP